MTTIEDKLKLFTSIIYEKIDEENHKLLKDFEIEKYHRTDEIKRTMTQERQEMLLEIDKRAKMKASEIVTAAKISAQQELLSLKERLIEEVKKEIETKFKEFINTYEYKAILFNSIKASLKKLGQGKYIIFLTEQDYQKYCLEIERDVLSQIDCDAIIKKASYQFVGGIIVEDVQGRYRLDNSILTKINDNRAIIGLEVMKNLN
ncbi:MAG: H+transporting two-sector ATPase subunit [Clostridiales bacterium]|nr:H+transporting two-sector ATPase subunit [Clostridiales bacterium]